MNIIPGDVIIEPATNRSTPASQPVEALAQLDPLLDEAQVRQAIANAEANNQDPQSLTMQDYAQVPVTTTVSAPAPAPAPVEVPQKFLKPDGAVDVEKISASTAQLEQAIQQKEAAITKTVDDYMRAYNERETQFRNLPNPQRLAQGLPSVPPAPPLPTPDATNQNFEDVVRRDWQQDPLMTTTRLIDLALQQRLQPLEAKEKSEAVRQNLQALAAKDPRVLREDVYAAMNAKLQSDPDLWKLKNPHKAAFLEVKEELRLGDAPSGAQAQPSRPLSPVLGGGSPPSAPSSSVQAPPTAANLNTLDLRDKTQEARGDAAIRELLARG